MTLREETLKEFHKEISNLSGLSLEEKMEWYSYIKFLHPEEVFFALDLLRLEPEKFLELHRNIKEKKRILAAFDDEAWKALLAQEKHMLEEAAKPEK